MEEEESARKLEEELRSELGMDEETAKRKIKVAGKTCSSPVMGDLHWNWLRSLLFGDWRQDSGRGIGMRSRTRRS